MSYNNMENIDRTNFKIFFVFSIRNSDATTLPTPITSTSNRYGFRLTVIIIIIRYWRSYSRDSVGAAVYASIRLWFWLRRRSSPRTCPVPGICRSTSPPWEVSKFSSPSRPSRLWTASVCFASSESRSASEVNTTRAGSERTSSSESSAAAVAAAAIRSGGCLQRDVIISCIKFYYILLPTSSMEMTDGRGRPSLLLL